MPSVIRLLRLATLPETRHVVAAAARSDALRIGVDRARSDRSGLLRDLADPRAAAALIREAIKHPATRELADVGLLLLPGRYLPVGMAATWLSRRLLDARRSEPRSRWRGRRGG